MNCDRIAGSYRWLEYAAFGRELERRRFRYLNECAAARRALVLGDGDGRFLASLVRTSRACIDYLDGSARMLELAQSRAGCERVRYTQADARAMDWPRGEYDLIVTNFFLDCFDESDAAELIARIAAAAAPGARWLIAEFRETRTGWRGVWSRAWLWLLYSFFGIATGLKTRRLVDYRPMLQARGFRLAKEDNAWFGLLVSELWLH